MSPEEPKGSASQREFPTVASPILRAGWWQWHPAAGTRGQAGLVVTGEQWDCVPGILHVGYEVRYGVRIWDL